MSHMGEQVVPPPPPLPPSKKKEYQIQMERTVPPDK